MGMQEARAVLASRREEIIDHIRILQRRRGRESSFKLSVLSSILSARFGGLAKDMRWFIAKQLTREQRIVFRILNADDRLEEPKKIDLPVPKKIRPPKVREEPEFIIEWITVAELKAMHAKSRAEELRLRREERIVAGLATAARRLEARRKADIAKQEAAEQYRLSFDQRIAVKRSEAENREARRKAEADERQRIREAKETARLQKKARLKVEREAKRAARAERIAAEEARRETKRSAKEAAAQLVLKPIQEKQPTVPVRAATPKPALRTLIIETPRKITMDIPSAIKRAVRAIKGSLEINDENVAFRAAMYCEESREDVKAHVAKLTIEQRTELGFAGTEKKPDKKTVTRPVSPSIVAKGL